MYLNVSLYVCCIACLLQTCWARKSKPERRHLELPHMQELVGMLVNDVSEELSTYHETHDPDNFYRSNFTRVAERVADMRNPCFEYEGTTQCYPSFLLIGVPKGGTTTMASVLMCHQSIMQALKEPHVWTRHSYKTPRDPPLYGSYTNTLMRDPRRRTMVFGDYSVSTFWQWSSFNPNHRYSSVPTQIRHTLPDVPLVVMLRDPVKRAVSDYFYFRKHRNFPENATVTFHEAVVKGIEYTTSCFQKHSINDGRIELSLSLYNCLFRHEDLFKHTFPRFISIGLYALSLAIWRRVFPREQLLILRSDDFFADPRDAVEQTLAHFSLPSERFWRRCGKLAFQKKASAPTVTVAAESIELLREFYAPFNRVLAEMLDDDRFLWGS